MQGAIRLPQFEHKYHKYTGDDIPKLQKINALIDRSQAGVRVRAGFAPFRICEHHCRRAVRGIQSPGIGRGHTLASTLIGWGCITPITRTLRITQSLQTAQKSAERGVGLLDLEALI